MSEKNILIIIPMNDIQRARVDAVKADTMLFMKHRKLLLKNRLKTQI